MAEIIWSPASGFCVPIINYIVEVLNTTDKDKQEWHMLYDDVPGDWYVKPPKTLKVSAITEILVIKKNQNVREKTIRSVA